jgi:CRISPR-associated protein Csm2
MNFHDKGKPWQGGSKPQYGGQSQDTGPSKDMEDILKRIDVRKPAAKEIAKSARAGKKEKNKSTQLRRFYDEIVMWDQRIRQLKEEERSRVYGTQYLPLIKMLNAKAAYAESRELVDRNFVELLRRGLSQLDPDKPGVFCNFKLFMEAFMGFYKLHGPK